MFVSKKAGRLLAVVCALILSAGSLLAQSIVVTGKVVDKNNEPIIGAYVVVVGTTVGTSTDANGVYSINVPANGTLQFTCIGYKTQEVLVAGRSNIPVILAETPLPKDATTSRSSWWTASSTTTPPSMAATPAPTV